MSDRPTRIAVAFALLLTTASLGVVLDNDPDKLVDWFIAFSATVVAAVIAVVGGIWLFRFQGQEAESELRKKLRTRVALEWKRNLERLEHGVTTPFLRQGTRERVGEVVTAELSTVALQDLIHSDAFDAEETLEAMRLEARISAYMQDVEFLLEKFQPAASAQALASTFAEMNNRKDLLINDLGDGLQDLRNQGVEVPD